MEEEVVEIDLGFDPEEEYDAAGSIDLTAAGELVEATGGNVTSRDVMRNYVNRGAQFTRQGVRHVLKLPAVLVGREWRTMPEWVRAFAKERLKRGVEPGRRAAPAVPKGRPKRSRGSALRRAGEVLDAAGI